MAAGGTREHAQQLDASDPLASYRERFFHPEKDLIYLDGNSLGRPTLATLDDLSRIAREAWGRKLITSWNEGWIDSPQRIGARIAELIGAGSDEVVVCDSTSINLFKLTLAAIAAQENRHKIITDDLNFPSDLYVLQGARQLNPALDLVTVSSADGIHGPEEALLGAIDTKTALVTLSHVNFKSGFLYDMAAITSAAQKKGAWLLWDLSHSAGTVPIHLSDLQVEMAVGCTYKYLNGGPGAPAFLYIRRDLQDRLLNPISGWFGHENPFEFTGTYSAAPGIRKFLTGTPPILSLLPIETAVDLICEAGIKSIRQKSQDQTEYMIDQWQRHLQPLAFRLNSPLEGWRRGGHVALGHHEGYRICKALIEEKNVLPDFRAPDNIRLGFSALYTRFVDIFDAVISLRDVVQSRAFERYPVEPEGVT